MDPAAPAPPPRRWTLAAAVALLTVVAFLPSLSGRFTNWDDDVNFTRNENYRGLGPDQLKWMFTDLFGHYMPITWLTLGLDYVLWGMNPVGYHATSLAFHAANAALFFLFLHGLLRRCRPADDPTRLFLAAAAGALFFSLHPLRVESVSWITERRDLTSGFFFLLTLLAYLRMTDETPGSASYGKWLALSAGAFLGSCLCKAMGMTLPLVLLLLDVWPLKRFSPGRRKAVLLEKIPFLILMIAAVILTGIGQRHAKALYPYEAYPLPQILGQPGYRISFYVLKTFVPLGLSPLYWYVPEMGIWHVVGAVAVVGATIAVLLYRKQAPAATATWLSFGLLIGPVAGLAQAGPHFAADRYTYLACLPFAALLSAVLLVPGRLSQNVRYGVTGAALALLTVLTVLQQRVWQDSAALWDHVLRLDPKSYMAYNNRGADRAERGDSAGAMSDYDASIALRSDWEKSWNNRGVEYAKKGDHVRALECFNRSLQIQPDQTDPYGYRALSRIRVRDFAGARSDLDEALRRRPEALYYVKRAMLRGAAQDLDGAIADSSEALRLKPDYIEAWINRGMARAQKGDGAGARQDLETALRAVPADSPQRHQIEKLLSQLQPR